MRGRFLTEEEYRALEPLYDEAKREIPTWDRISLSAVQRRYRLGYNRAQRLLETLTSAGVLHWNSTTGAFTSVAKRERGVHSA